jgi:hypothetical protein
MIYQPLTWLTFCEGFSLMLMLTVAENKDMSVTLTGLVNSRRIILASDTFTPRKEVFKYLQV